MVGGVRGMVAGRLDRKEARAFNYPNDFWFKARAKQIHQLTLEESSSTIFFLSLQK